MHLRGILQVSLSYSTMLSEGSGFLIPLAFHPEHKGQVMMLTHGGETSTFLGQLNGSGGNSDTGTMKNL